MSGNAGPILIVGGGAAGATCARTLVRAGRDDVLLISDENARPYDRTALSKRTLLEGGAPPDLHPDVPEDVILKGCVALGVDLSARSVTTTSGPVPFGTLVLATGAEPRRPPLSGIDAPDVLTLRDSADAARLHAALEPGARLLVLGAGLIGLEVAAIASALGVHVTVVDVADRPMARVLPPRIATIIESAHREAGVELVLGARPTEIAHGPTGPALVLDDGSRLAGDVLLVATGVAPRVELAASAGLAVDDGILVDELLRTSHPDVLAVGDASRVAGPDGRHGSRTEAWTPALAMGLQAGRNLLGEGTPYREVPWAWSDQFDLQIQITGDPLAGDRSVTRGDVDGPEGLTVIALRDGRVVGAAGVGRGNGIGRAIRPLGNLIGRGVPVTAAELSDPSSDLRSLAQRSVE